MTEALLPTDGEGGGCPGERLLPAGPVVKVCGLTREQDVEAAVRAGAWAVGFVFAPSARQVDAARVAEIIAGCSERRGSWEVDTYGSLTIGVFGDASVEEIVQTVRVAGLDGVQLHGAGGPTPAQVREALADQVPPGALLSESCPGPRSVLIVRAVGVAVDGEAPAILKARVDSLCRGADLILFDTSSGGRCGGTGMVFPWEAAAPAAGSRRYLVAGGIGPADAAEALARSGAWGVDVSGGVESAPGQKDPRAVARLMSTVNGLSRL